MKKIISVFICLLFILLAVLPASAAMTAESEKEYLDDGSYFTVITDDSVKKETEGGIFARIMAFLRKLVEFFRGQKTVSKTKYLNYYSSDGELLWTAKLKADFIYSKNSAVCTSSEFGIDIFDSDWKLLESECSKALNTASATFSVRQYKLLIPLKIIEKTLTLTCDTKGNVA